MARVLFAHDTPDAFGREAYIPADPIIVWRDTCETLKDLLDVSTLQGFNSSAEKVYPAYIDSFGENGICITEGKLTLYYSGVWVNYLILSLCKKRPRSVCLSVSGFRSFRDPVLGQYNNILKTSSDIKVIVDQKVDPNPVENLRGKYPKQFDVRYSPVGTTHRMAIVGDELAIDGLRILPLEMSAPGYIGTIYLNKGDRVRLRKTFNDRWDIRSEQIS